MLGREWAYHGIKPCIVAEELLTDESGDDLKDYKVFCFNGKPKFIQVDYDRFKGHKRRLYTVDWELMQTKITYPDDEDLIMPKPFFLDELLEMSKISGFVDRARGTGRPTKKDRRSMEEFITPEYFGDDDFDFEFDFEEKE